MQLTAPVIRPFGMPRLGTPHVHELQVHLRILTTACPNNKASLEGLIKATCAALYLLGLRSLAAITTKAPRLNAPDREQARLLAKLWIQVHTTCGNGVSVVYSQIFRQSIDYAVTV